MTKSFKTYLSEDVYGFSGSGKTKYKIYHSSMHNALREAIRYIKIVGYEFDIEDFDRQIQNGGGWTDINDMDEGKTKKYDISILKKGCRRPAKISHANL